MRHAIEHSFDGAECSVVIMNGVSLTSRKNLRIARVLVAEYCDQRPNADVRFLWVAQAATRTAEPATDLNAIYRELSSLLAG